MRVLAIDPGSREYGYAVSDSEERLEGYGSGNLSKYPYEERFAIFKSRLEDIREKYRPTEIAIEQPVRFRGKRIPELEVAFHTAVTWARLEIGSQRVYTYHPATWRVGIAGTSSASKEKVQRIMVMHFPELNGLKDHITDAAAIMLYHFAIRRREELIKLSDK